jgi:hypothetical protein
VTTRTRGLWLIGLIVPLLAVASVALAWPRLGAQLGRDEPDRQQTQTPMEDDDTTVPLQEREREQARTPVDDDRPVQLQERERDQIPVGNGEPAPEPGQEHLQLQDRDRALERDAGCDQDGGGTPARERLRVHQDG